MEKLLAEGQIETFMSILGRFDYKVGRHKVLTRVLKYLNAIVAITLDHSLSSIGLGARGPRDPR